MPYYEFECPNGHVVEELVKMDTDHVECPECRENAAKIISRCTFTLKGGGWYADGYSSKSK